MYGDILDFFEERKLPKFRIKQFQKALFNELVLDFDEINVFPKHLRDELKENFSLTSMFLVESHKSGNTIKFVLKTQDNNFVESVLMLHNDGRRTVCVSSQVFCAVGCTFCATGANSFKRSLTQDEIIEQVLFVERYIKSNKDEIGGKSGRVTNVVFMGMGEPFLAYHQVVGAVKILNSPDCFNIGARHITVSTSGIVPKIYEYAEIGIQTRLAISLHAPNDKLRSEIMPLNKRYPLADLMKACDYFVEKTNKRVSYEYVLIRDVNDTMKCAQELVDLLKNRLAHVNLLIYNPHEFAKYKMPLKEQVLKFRDYLQSHGLEVSVRKSMGDDISGACGQLSGKVIKKGYEEKSFDEALKS